MCKTHWNQYTAGLARDAKARKAPAASTEIEATPIVEPEAGPAAAGPPTTRKRTKAAPAAEVQAEPS
jgi:hypothetical protein